MSKVCKDNIFGETYPKRPATNIQWVIDDEKKKDYYDDLGILGEISLSDDSDDCCTNRKIIGFTEVSSINRY